MIGILKKIQDNTKILGICLGMQLLCLGSDEGNKEGLNVFNVFCKSLIQLNQIIYLWDGQI